MGFHTIGYVIWKTSYTVLKLTSCPVDVRFGVLNCVLYYCNALFNPCDRYQENQFRLQRNVAFQFNPKGNTAGRNEERRPVSLSNSPLKKVKRH